MQGQILFNWKLIALDLNEGLRPSSIIVGGYDKDLLEQPITYFGTPTNNAVYWAGHLNAVNISHHQVLSSERSVTISTIYYHLMVPQGNKSIQYKLQNLNR
jgi:hypothetical protein